MSDTFIRRDHHPACWCDLGRPGYDPREQSLPPLGLHDMPQEGHGARRMSQGFWRTSFGGGKDLSSSFEDVEGGSDQ